MSIANLKKLSDLGSSGLKHLVEKNTEDSRKNSDEKDMFKITLRRMQSFDPKYGNNLPGGKITHQGNSPHKYQHSGIYNTFQKPSLKKQNSMYLGMGTRNRGASILKLAEEY